jgi:hypothetical protein
MKARVFALILVISGISQTLLAVDVSYEGYFRARGNYYYDLDLNRDNPNSPNSRAFTDFRFRLNPTFYITDKVRIRSSLNFFDGVLGDKPFRASPYSNPATAYNHNWDPNEIETGTLGRPISSLSQTSYGGYYTPDGLVETTDLKAIDLRRVWAEIDLPYGTVKVGRMPFQLGMGIYANAGDDPDQEFGSTRDRIIFDTAFGPYYVRPGLGWLVEGALDQSADDFMEYFFQFGRKLENQEISIYLAYNNQSNYRPDTTVTTGTLVDRGTHYWSFDFSAQNQFEPVNLMGELALFSGRAVGKELLAINAAGRAEWNFKPSTVTTEIGYSSGTDAADANAGDLKTIPFNRDYNISLLLFEEAIPGGKNSRTNAGTLDTTPSAPHSGAISNVIYARLRWDYDVAPFFQPSINIVVPYAAKKPAGGSGKLYGIEYDFITKWPIGQHFIGDLSFGHLIPGTFYDNFSNGKSHSALVFRGGITAKF